MTGVNPVAGIAMWEGVAALLTRIRGNLPQPCKPHRHWLAGKAPGCAAMLCSQAAGGAGGIWLVGNFFDIEAGGAVLGRAGIGAVGTLAFAGKQWQWAKMLLMRSVQ